MLIFLLVVASIYLKVSSVRQDVNGLTSTQTEGVHPRDRDLDSSASEISRPTPGAGFSAQALLLEATKTGDVMLAKLSLSSGARANMAYGAGKAPLSYAAKYGFADLVDMLLENSADINCEDDEGFTPLHLSASRGHSYIVGSLLQASANVDAQNERGETALMIGASLGLKAVVQTLLDHNANTMLKNSADLSVMDIAVKGNHGTIVVLLNEVLASNLQDRFERDKFACSVYLEEADDKSQKLCEEILYAVRNTYAAFVSWCLDKGAPLHIKDPKGNSLLCIACIGGRTDIVHLLLSKGVSVDEKNMVGNSALMLAAKYGNEAALRLLLENKASVDFQNLDGDTALLMAAGLGSCGSVKALLDSRAALDLQNEHGDTAIFVAVQRGDLRVVDALIRAKADVNLENVNMEGPIMAGARLYSPDIVKMLLGARACPLARNCVGFSALDTSATLGDLFSVQTGEPSLSLLDTTAASAISGEVLSLAGVTDVMELGP